MPVLYEGEEEAPLCMCMQELCLQIEVMVEKISTCTAVALDRGTTPLDVPYSTPTSALCTFSTKNV